jgi:phosphatidylserine decarboxylase
VLSRATGRLADLRLPSPVLRPLLRLYVRAFGVDLAEAAEPLESFPTFNAFFTRRLREGARPVATGPGVVVSPSDSRLSAIGPVPSDGRLEQVKGSAYTVDALLGSPEDAATFRQGAHATLYLSPAMYHRVHAPVDGRIRGWRYVPGRLFPVNAAGVRSVSGLFTRNERVVIFLDTDAHGPAAVVLVGAANVGRISLAFADLATNQGRPATCVVPPEPVAVRRGDELGAFNLGSTVVLLVADAALVPVARPGELVRVGRPLWTRTG